MILVQCAGCGQRLKVQDSHAGRRVKCPSCGDPVLVPAARPGSAGMPPYAPAPGRPHVPPQPRASAPVANPYLHPHGSEAAFAGMETGRDSPGPTRYRRRSPVRASAVHGAILGAITGGVLVALLKPSEAKLLEAIGKAFKEASPETIRGALLGAVCGLAVGGMVVTFAGRSLETILGVLLLAAGGGVYGAFRKAELVMNVGDVPGLGTPGGWETMMILGPLAGIPAGLMVGALVGALIAALRH